MIDDRLREILSSIVEAQLELIAAVADKAPPSGLSATGRRLEKIRRDLEPSSIDLLPAFQKS
jgi:hypothetical protein